jgi:hypothetical protein
MSGNMARSEILYEQAWTKDTNYHSLSLRSKISSARESQCNFWLFGKTVGITWILWQPWTPGWDYIPSSARSCRKRKPRKNWLMWLCEINIVTKTEKDMWYWWHSKWMPEASSKTTTGAYNKRNQSLYSTFIFSRILEGRKNDSITRIR